MQKFYRGIVNHPRWILLLFAVCTAVCLVLQREVSVNYDMTDYLPADSPSTVSLKRMEEEFEGGIPNARIMVRDVTVPEALEYKDRLAECARVTGVLWLDDAANIYQPLERIDRDTLDSYYVDGNALFTVTIEEGHEVEGVAAIRAVIGEDGAMSGAAVSTAVATTSTVLEVGLIAAFAVLFVIAVLLLTTGSWLEPVLVMAGLGVAIVLNAGTNLIFGEISFVTNAAGSILQLAVSLDYSVFLIHRFEECLAQEPDPKSAMVAALCRSTTSILSSGLTTVIGFVALVFMRFGIGPDLGLALAKGVAISLVVVFVFMPCLILTFYRQMLRTHHRSFVPGFSGFARVVRRMMFPCVCAFLVVVAPSYLASNANSYYYGASKIFGEETQLGADTAAIEDTFGRNDTYVLMVPKGSTAQEKELSDALRQIPQVESIISYVDTVGAEIPMSYLDEDTLSQLVSDHYSRMVLSLDAAYESEETFRLVEAIRETARERYGDDFYLAGEGVSTYDLMDTITDDTLKVNAIAILAVFVVLLFSFKSVLLPVVLVLSIETAIWINVAIPYFAGNVVFYISYLIISSVQLGATVDYAILITDRYMEFRRSMGRMEAIQEVISSCTVSVLTSGSALIVVGFLMGYISTHGILSQLGMFLGRGALLSLVMVLFVLPGLLYLLDKPIQKVTRGLKWVQETKEVSAK